MDGSAEGRFSLRAICKEGATFLQTLSAIAFVLRVSLVDSSSTPHPPALPRIRHLNPGGSRPAYSRAQRAGTC
jgi:hypothetical protein